MTIGEPRVKLNELADEAGVSISTVSKVLNGRSDVSASTRTKVESVLERQGYGLFQSQSPGLAG